MTIRIQKEEETNKTTKKKTMKLKKCPRIYCVFNSYKVSSHEMDIFGMNLKKNIYIDETSN